MINERRLKMIIEDEIKQELLEQGFLATAAGAARGAVQGATTGVARGIAGGTVTGAVKGAVSGAVSGAEAGKEAVGELAKAATTLRNELQRGTPAQMGIDKFELNGLLTYIGDWGEKRANDPAARARVLWAMFKVITLAPAQAARLIENFSKSDPVKMQIIMSEPVKSFGDAVAKVNNIQMSDPKWMSTFSAAIKNNKIL